MRNVNRTVIEVKKLESCDVVSMFGAVCKLLTHCGTCFEAISPQDSLAALMHLLDPANFVEGQFETIQLENLYLKSNCVKIQELITVESR